MGHVSPNKIKRKKKIFQIPQCSKKQIQKNVVAYVQPMANQWMGFQLDNRINNLISPFRAYKIIRLTPNRMALTLSLSQWYAESN